MGSAAWWVPVLPCSWVPTCPRCALWAHAARLGVPPLVLLLVAARIKHARPFGGYPIPILSSAVFSHGESALWGLVPFLLRLRPLPVRSGPMAVLTTDSPRVS